MKQISHTNISLYITFLAVFNIAIHGADTTIQFKTKEDLKEFYFKHIHLKPQELDQQFDRKFFEKNPLSIPVKFPGDYCEKKPGARFISNWPDVIRTWNWNCHVSLLEGIFVYINHTDPDVLICLHNWLSDFDKLVIKDHMGTDFQPSSNKPIQIPRTYGDIIPGLIAAKIYNREISDQEREEAFLNENKNLVYKYRVASEDVGKAIFNHSHNLTDDCLKNIAPWRPDAIAAFLRMYEPLHSLTIDQATRFKNLGFQICEKI